MRKLILIKHSAPEIVPNIPPEQWRLSERGRALCIPLADRLGESQPTVLISSEEPKAAETAELVAARLAIPWRTAPGLHEHDRSNVPHMRSGEFIASMELLFRKPAELVLGRETADAALARFRKAIDGLLASEPDGNLAVVSHGTVIALLAAQKLTQKPFLLWREMGLPSFAILSVPEFQLKVVISRIE